MDKERRRVLIVGERQYLWRTSHRHAESCQEALRLRQLGSAAGLTLIFGPDGKRRVCDGGTSAIGVIWLGDRSLNLNRPGVVRAFVDAAVRYGWMTQARTDSLRNGWDLFDEVCTALTAEPTA